MCGKEDKPKVLTTNHIISQNFVRVFIALDKWPLPGDLRDEPCSFRWTIKQVTPNSHRPALHPSHSFSRTIPRNYKYNARQPRHTYLIYLLRSGCCNTPRGLAGLREALKRRTNTTAPFAAEEGRHVQMYNPRQ